MKFKLIDWYSFSIGIAAIIGWIRFRKIHSAYYPFIYCIWLAFINEILGFVLINTHHYNAINNNFYVLAESLLFTWQFRNWQLFERRKYVFRALITILILFWGIEAFFISGINQTITYFRIFYSFFIVLMSIETINKELAKERTNILKNSIFLICMIFIIYYTCTIIVGIFWIYGFGGSVAFRRHMVWILIYVNLFSNLIYALAVLWTPKKLRFSLPF